MRKLVPFAIGDVKKTRVLDFGESIGNHYQEAKFVLQKQYFERIALETNSIVQCAKKLILSNNKSFFIDDVDLSRNIEFDLIFANSSLQYTPGPNLYPKWLLEMRAKYLYITRTLLSEKSFYHFPQISKLQEHGPGELDSKTKIK